MAMWWRVLPGVAFLVILASARGAQVTIENPKNLPVDRERVALLYRMTCQEVAETFHVRHYEKLQYPLTLVLGDEGEHYGIDHKTGAGIIYLQQWEEVRFAGSATMLTLHHLISTEQYRAVVTRTLKRFRETNPVAISETGQRKF